MTNCAPSLCAVLLLSSVALLQARSGASVAEAVDSLGQEEFCNTAAATATTTTTTATKDAAAGGGSSTGNCLASGDVSAQQQPLHGFFITMKDHTQRSSNLLDLLRQEPAGKVLVQPHVADVWHSTPEAGLAAAEPRVSDSHVAVLRRCIAEGRPTCLIMEDDAVWEAGDGPESEVSVYRTFQQALQDLDGRPWDVIILGHNILRGKHRELTHGPFQCEEDLEIVTPTLARLKWRTGWGCQSYVVHERYYGQLIQKVWGSRRYACIEELTDIGDDQWFLTSPLPVSQAAKPDNFRHSQTHFLRDCVGRSNNVLPATATRRAAASARTSSYPCTSMFVGDTFCDATNNRRACDWDGGDCFGRRPVSPSLADAASDAAALLSAADNTTRQLQMQASTRSVLPRVHILHVPKTGGLSVRSALGCFCASDDFNDPTGGKGAGNCDTTTYSGPFVCHGHAATCRDVPFGEPYVVFFRDPYTKVMSATAHQQAIFPGLTLADSAFVRRPQSPHQRPQSDYVSCGLDNPPAFVGHTESLAEDWERFRAAFAPEIQAAEQNTPRLSVPTSLPHRHNKEKRSSSDSAEFTDPGLVHSWHKQIAVQYRRDFFLGNYTVDEEEEVVVLDSSDQSDGNDEVIAQEFEDAFEVTGSDISAMNGIYIRTDDWDGHSLYTNQGLTAVLYFRSSLGDRGAWVVNSNHNLGGWMFLQNNPEPEDPAGHYLVAPASLRMTETPVDVRRVQVPRGTQHVPKAFSRYARNDTVGASEDVYVLHIAKTGGRSIRDAVGCLCGANRRTGLPDQCNVATSQGRFQCMGHDTTCHDLPVGARYAVFFRNPFDRFLSAHNYQRNIRRNPNLSAHRQGKKLASLNDTLFMSRHQIPQWQYISCAENPPDFIGFTDSLAKDWQRFRSRYSAQCEEANCKVEVPHRHRQEDMMNSEDAGIQVRNLDDPVSKSLVAHFYRHDFGLRDDWNQN